jgi:hypothetical protein
MTQTVSIFIYSLPKPGAVMGEVSVEANLFVRHGQVMPELKPEPPMTQTGSIFMPMDSWMPRLAAAGPRVEAKPACGL